ncbi:GNAT family N-acetyltransferase [Moorella sulfitireducens]|uniref:GNAT family N-acetyltransferase n=1 Tax=Neomoorella sulfitireducens TaxID=2972948 RepID=UPI0021AD3D95|nr:GNAT family N-acetyltransferase [Moorella sulfitireducens]
MVNNLRARAEVTLARPEDGPELRALLLDWGMDLAGEPEQHAVIKVSGKIFAGGKITWLEENAFHMELLAVKREARGRGLGGMLLLELIKKPWAYCDSSPAGGCVSYRVTTIARGEAAGFYRRYGFRNCHFSDLATIYREQCRDCPEREACRPVPMIYIQEVS